MPLPFVGTVVATSGTSLIESGNVGEFAYDTSWRVNVRSSRFETV
jgi:hypothetical protein